MSPHWRVPITHQDGVVIGLVTPEVREDDRHPHIYFSSIIILLSSGFTYSHLPWRPVNLKMSLQRQFHFPPVLFTCLMKNWGVPEIIAGELLHSGQNSRGICKSIKNDIFWLENNFYLHYSHKGVIVTVTETISKLQNWHTCKNFRGTLPCNLSKCAVFHT